MQEWNGQLSEAATAILQQHATQGDLTELQVIALRWRALAQQAKDESHQIHFKVLYEALKDLEKHWDRDLLSNEEVNLNETFSVCPQCALYTQLDLRDFCLKQRS